MSRRILAFVLGLLTISTIAEAQLGSRPASDVTPEELRTLATPQRADLALSLRRLDEELTLVAPDAAEVLRGVNNTLDDALYLAPSPNSSATLAAIDRQSASLRAGTDFLPQHMIAMSLQVRANPPVWRPELPAPTLTAARLYVVRFNREGYEVPRIVVALKDHAGAVVTEREFTVGEDSQWPQSFPLFDGAPPADLESGAYTLTARWAEGEPREFEVGRWQVAGRSLDERRSANAARIDQAVAAHPELSSIAELVRSRNGLLSDSPSPDAPAQWNTNLDHLADEVDAEIAALEGGRNPFAGLDGDWWVRAPLAGAGGAVRVFVPADLGEQPAPVVIMLHGVGADENTVLDACNDGMLRRLASERGFVVVSPESSAMAYPAAFDALLEVVGAWRPVDRARVYLVGHSSGGTLASAIARARPDGVAALCLVAAAPAFSTTADAPPVLLVSGGDDGIARPSRTREAVAAARAQGGRAELIEIANAGHALSLRQSLEQIVDWLLRQE